MMRTALKLSFCIQLLVQLSLSPATAATAPESQTGGSADIQAAIYWKEASPIIAREMANLGYQLKSELPIFEFPKNETVVRFEIERDSDLKLAHGAAVFEVNCLLRQTPNRDLVNTGLHECNVNDQTLWTYFKTQARDSEGFVTGAFPVQFEIEKVETTESTSPFEQERVKQKLANGKYFVLAYEGVDKIPERLKKEIPPSVLDTSKWRWVYITVAVENDSGLGVIGVVGDDHGFTTGVSFQAGAIYGETYDVTLTLASNLYTRALKGTRSKLQDGTETEAQTYRNETIWEAMIESRNSGRLFFWNGRAGLVNTSSEEMLGMLDGTFQQSSLHRLLNVFFPKSNTLYRYVDDGRPNIWGVYIGVMVGLQDQYRLNDRLDLKVRIGTGVQVSNLPEHLYFNSIASAELRYHTGFGGDLVIGMGAESFRHLGGTQTVMTRKVAYSTRSYEAGVVFTRRKGVLLNGSRLYNRQDNEPTAKLYVTFFLDAR